MNEAKILDVYLSHSQQEVENEKKKYKSEVRSLQLQHEKVTSDMKYQSTMLDKQIEHTKDSQKNRNQSEGIIKKRAERLKKSIAKL
mmetsp:Transcript_5188/g.4769  ORF Transcript_5188/g.4769 Transcript_5188/m.4769 type:complete len:86 (+) Transcript_5188:249-506(+)